VVTSSAAEAAATRFIDVSGLSSELPPGKLPAHWEMQSFPSITTQTKYRIVTDSQYGAVIRAEAVASAAGLIRRISVDPHEFPNLTWSWKVSKILPGSAVGRPEGDDFPARLLVSFGSTLFGGIPKRTLCYVWASSEPVDTITASPSHKGVTTIVASSGDQAVGSWQDVRRNIVDDYFRVYGEMPGSLQAISLMSDADNTADHVVAWYGPIFLHK
jgi:hypothetical protein